MESMHNICSVDVGAWTSKLAALNNQHRFQILVNQANFRQTPTVVAFTPAERLIGDQAVIKIKSNFKNTIRSPHRLIGLPKKHHLVQQQLKYSPLKYRIQGHQLIFTLEQGSTILQLSSQSLTTALFTKYKQIYEANSIKTDFLFISVQSYLSNGQRKALKVCAEAAGFKNVGLIEQWEAIAAEYYFVRQKDIQMLTDDILVIFVDFGYANFAVHACTISKNRISLLDQQHLRYTGSKNIDSLLTQFYIELAEKQSGSNIKSNPKALIKLQQAVEQQRKKLSANVENQLTIQCLIGDYDLSYNMTREELENIGMPIIAQFASAMQNLRSRVEPLARIHSVEVIGGFSRMPFMQDVVRTVFNMEPSKKMNASESVARGCTIAGASRLGLLRSSTSFVHNIRHPITLLSHSHVQASPNLLKRNSKMYASQSRKILFDKNSILPANTIIKIEGEGLNEVLICEQVHSQVNIIGYVCFKGTDNLTILIDNDGIMRARLVKNVFEDYDFGQIVSTDAVGKIKDLEQQMKARDNNIIQSYQLRNNFQSLLYNTRQNLKTKLKEYSPPTEQQILLQILQQSEIFLSNTNQHSAEAFKQRIQTINMLIAEPTRRKQGHEKCQAMIKSLKQRIGTVGKLHVNNKDIVGKLEKIEKQVVILYNKEAEDFWNGAHLNEQVLTNLMKQVDQLK